MLAPAADGEQSHVAGQQRITTGVLDFEHFADDKTLMLYFKYLDSLGDGMLQQLLEQEQQMCHLIPKPPLPAAAAAAARADGSTEDPIAGETIKP